jgi:hypothetical protein
LAESITAVAKSQQLDPPTDWNNFSPFQLERRELCRNNWAWDGHEEKQDAQLNIEDDTTLNELFYANYQSARKVKRGAVSFKTSLQAGRGAGRHIKQNGKKVE